MQNIKVKLKQLGEFKLGILILVLGIVIGIIFAGVLKGFYWNQINILDTNYFSKIRNATIDYQELLRYVLWKNFRIFILFWILTSTVLGIPYMTFSIMYGGFQAGFFLAVIIMKYHFKGLLLIFGYTFPHYILYIPIAILCLRIGFWLCKSMYYDTKMNKRKKTEKIVKHLILIIILGFALLLGSLLETYAGTFVLKKVLTIFK